MNRLFQLSGIVFVALVVVTMAVVGGAPGTDESAAGIASFYKDNEARELIAPFLFAATVPFLVLFAIAIARLSSSAWGHVVVGGAILAGSAILGTAAIHFALLDTATGDGAPSDALLALNALSQSAWVAFNAACGVMMLGAAGSLLTGAVQRPLGWIALVLGVVAFIPYAGFIALLGSLIWIVVTGILLSREKPTARYVARMSVFVIAAAIALVGCASSDDEWQSASPAAETTPAKEEGGRTIAEPFIPFVTDFGRKSFSEPLTRAAPFIPFVTDFGRKSFSEPPTRPAPAQAQAETSASTGATLLSGRLWNSGLPPASAEPADCKCFIYRLR